MILVYTRKLKMEVKELSYRFGQRLLFNNLTFNTVDNPLIIIEGKNGSGKSTLLKVLLGILRTQSGSVVASESIGYVPDSSEPYFVGMSPEVLFVFIQKQFRIERNFFEKHLSELKERFRLDNSIISKSILSLSLGERKKVMLIASFLTDAQLFIMDEPFSGLDEASLSELFKLISELLNVGKTFIIVTHGYSDKFSEKRKIIYL